MVDLRSESGEIGGSSEIFRLWPKVERWRRDVVAVLFFPDSCCRPRSGGVGCRDVEKQPGEAALVTVLPLTTAVGGEVCCCSRCWRDLSNAIGPRRLTEKSTFCADDAAERSCFRRSVPWFREGEGQRGPPAVPNG